MTDNKKNHPKQETVKHVQDAQSLSQTMLDKAQNLSKPNGSAAPRAPESPTVAEARALVSQHPAKRPTSKGSEP